MEVGAQATPFRDLDADLHAIALFEGSELPAELAHAPGAGDAKPSFKSLAVAFPEPGRRLAVVGLGKPEELSAERLRIVGALVAGEASKRRAASVAFELASLEPGEIPAEQAAAAITEGIILGSYRFDRFRSSDPDDPPPPDLARLVFGGFSDTGGLDTALGEARVTAEAQNHARDLQSLPANHATPTVLAERAQELAAGHDSLTCEVLGREEISARGMGGLRAVSQGSDEEPCLITLRHEGRGSGDVLGIVGKAVTFDSGGISIKPSAGMHEMKMDMSGGAAVIEAMGAIAELGIELDVVAVVPSTENMPSGHSMRPGDVITQLNGKTVEINNTDAEGRLILADALTWCVGEQGAARVIDLATLTGAALIALGSTYSALISNDDAFAATVESVAVRTGELAWRLPLHPDYKKLTTGTVADLTNAASKREAGTIYAGSFLEEFVDSKPWVHLDIAGTAWDSEREYAGKGPTGFGVRLLVALAKEMSHTWETTRLCLMERRAHADGQMMEVRELQDFLDAVAAEDDVPESVRVAAERAATAVSELRQQNERRESENAELLASLRERQRLLERLSRIQQKIVGRSALDEVLEAIVWGARELLGDETVGLRLIDADDPTRMVMVASTGVPPELLDDARHGRTGDGAGGLAIVEERLVVIEDYQHSGRSNNMFVRDGVKGAMAAPVREHGNVVGSLTVATHAHNRSYSTAEREMLLAFAEHASLALTDARTVEDALHNAFHDTLTELPNRELFSDRLAQALARASRAESRSAVIFCDLDGFKTVNDSLGHAAGDKLLNAVARRFETCVRAGDTAARIGGDEFAVLLENVNDEEVGVAARRILGAFADPFSISGREVYLSCSIGIAFGASESDDVMRNADLALYRAKARGRGRFEVFSPEMHTTVVQRMELEADFQRALRRDELELDYQPIFDLEAGSMVAMEALVRWNHPERGRLSPDEFIPMAESGNLIHALGRAVLRKACVECGAARAAGPQPATLQVTVNISSAQLREPGLVAEVSAALRDSGLSPDALIIELTETAFAEDIDAVSGRLAELRNLGVRIAVDDFGTGYSSLGHLSRFPIDYLKIARPFVVGIGSRDNDAAIARAIVYLAQSFGLDVIAEGIENQAQVRRLMELGCSKGQGFHLSLPLSGDAIIGLVQARAVDSDAVAQAESAPL